MTITEIIFWGSLLLTAYVYVMYPIIVWLLSGWCRDLSVSDDRSGDRPADAEWPQVSLVMVAHREEAVILERLENAVLIDYPADRFEVVVGCDGDEDLTGELVRSFDDPRVRLIQFAHRRGRASVLNDCIPEAGGEILVLCDANTRMHPLAVGRLVRHFRNPEVGGVCGKLVLTDPLTGRNIDGLCWQYENFLKRCEGRLGALPGADGAVYAIRKELYAPIPANTIIDDFFIGMRIHRSGHRLEYDDQAVAYEAIPATIGSEFDRRARTGTEAIASLPWLWPLLNPCRGRVAFVFWSHKVLRWFCPAFLIAAMVTNVALAHRPFYVRVLLLHEMFYLAVLIGVLCAGRWNGQRVWRLAGLFVSRNAALLVGFGRWLSRIRGGVWKRTERAERAE